MTGSVMAVAFVFLMGAGQPQDVAGNWRGTLKAGAIELPPAAHVDAR
jgi:hypothetical protein